MQKYHIQPAACFSIASFSYPEKISENYGNTAKSTLRVRYSTQSKEGHVQDWNISSREPLLLVAGKRAEVKTDRNLLLQYKPTLTAKFADQARAQMGILRTHLVCKSTYVAARVRYCTFSASVQISNSKSIDRVLEHERSRSRHVIIEKQKGSSTH